MNNIELAKRYHAFDFIRTFAMLIGIPFHAALAYGLIDHNWVVMEKNGSFLMDFLGYFIRIFRMPLFFFMAGFFSYLVYLKRKKHFLKDRFKRIAIPLFFFSVMLLPFMKLIWIVAEVPDLLFNLNFDKLFNYIIKFYWADSDEKHFRFPINFGHLWFLLYLLVISFATKIFSQFSLKKSQLIFLRKTLFIFPIALTFLILLLMKEAWVDKPFIWYPRLSLILYYSIFFFYGWLAFRFKIFEIIESISLTKWLLIFGFALILGGSRAFVQAGGLKGLFDNYVFLQLWMALSTWLLLFSSIGIVNILFKKGNEYIVYLGNASYFLYIIHLPIVTIFQLLLHRVSWHWGVKFIVVNIATILLIVPTYHYLVKGKFIDRLLKGKLI